MKLISPNFLKTINQQWEKEQILYQLFKDEEVVSLVMVKKNLSFDKACEWISEVLYKSEAPEASDSEKTIMKRVAKELISEWMEPHDNIGC